MCLVLTLKYGIPPEYDEIEELKEKNLEFSFGFKTILASQKLECALVWALRNFANTSLDFCLVQQVGYSHEKNALSVYSTCVDRTQKVGTTQSGLEGVNCQERRYCSHGPSTISSNRPGIMT